MVWWVVGLIGGYLVLAPLLALGALKAMLTAGVVDWSGASRPAPADPLTIGYRGDPTTAFGWSFEIVRYPTELGDAEAWIVPAEQSSTLWAIWVHGIGGTRENGYRMVETLRDAGLTVLMITYRNDRDAHPGADRLYSFGLSEWRDLEAAVAFAVDRGAEHIVVAAESMGAAITGQYLRHGLNTDRVVGLALDAPALDVPAIVAASGRRHRVPLAGYVGWAAVRLWGVLATDLRQAVCLDAVASFGGPIFLSHGNGDPLVPYEISERLVTARPDIAFWSTPSTRHPMSFEADRDGYRGALREWLARVRARLSEGRD